MCKTFRINSSLLMWCALSTVLLTNAFETYSETDQLAEESIGRYNKEGYQETTINPISSTKEPNDDKSAKDSTKEDDLIDPLQKILPKIKFNCKGKSEGYYADKEFCEVFHFCKTNGFRFTFICPPESYYNDKLMACEFNSTVSKCVDREKHNKTEIKDLNAIKDTSIKTSVNQSVEVLEKSSSQINTNTEKSESVTTAEPKKAADPYLIRRKNHLTFQSPTKQIRDKLKAQNKTDNIRQEVRSQNYTKVSENKENVTQTIIPFTGFRKLNRNKTQLKFKNNSQIITNENKITNNPTNGSRSNEYSVQIPSNALPVLKSIRPQLISNSNQQKTYRNKSRTKTATTTSTSTTTTTTPHPSLLGPSFKDWTTLPPFDYFTPIFNSDRNLQTNSDFFPLSMHKRPQNAEKDKSKQRKPVMTQNFYNSIRHTTRRPNFQRESQIEETLKQSETKSEVSVYKPSEDLTNSNRYKFNMSPLFNIEQKDQLNDDDTHLSESQIHELIERLKELDDFHNSNPDFQPSEYSESETDIETNDKKEDMNERPHISVRNRRDKNRPKKFLTVPLLVPTGVSKSDLRRKLSSTLLKPTVLPLNENGDEMPAYVLQFQKSEKSMKKTKHKHRSKRQTIGWNSFQSNPFARNTYYMPMNSMSSPVYSPFHNHLRYTLPMNTFRSRLEIGDRPFGLNSAAQQHIPYYSPPKRPFIPNNFIGHNYYKDNNIYDLSEFSDFYENPLSNRQVPIMANDMSPYRPVSLKRPGFKRPPRRERIPETKKNINKNNSTTRNDTKTTVRPFNSVPVSPRPYSQPIVVKQQFYARNSNPFSDLSDESISEAIKAFDSSEDHLQPLDPTFDSQPIFPFNSHSSFSDDFIPITPRTETFADSLNGRSSRISKFSEIPFNNYVSDNFPPLPSFGDPEYRLPFVDIQDSQYPTLTNLPRSSRPDNSNKGFVQQRYGNGSRYATPYSPEITFNTNIENERQESNETERNPNHNYDNIDKNDLQVARTVDNLHNLRQIHRTNLNWDNIVGQYNKPNVSVSNNKSQMTANKNDSKEQKESENSKFQRYVSYGTRLSGNTNRYSQIPEVSVKTSVSSVSSMQPEASDQIVISRKFGSSPLSSQTVNDKQKSIDELYNQRAFDRLMLFNYYNHLNSQKTSTTTTTTVSPLNGKYPSTSHWSIRGWTGQYFPQSTTTTTAAPIITTNSNIEYLDLFESETKVSETTTELPETKTTEKPDPPYKRVFNSQMGATFHSNKYSKPLSISQKTRSDISNYLSSLTLKTI